MSKRQYRLKRQIWATSACLLSVALGMIIVLASCNKKTETPEPDTANTPLSASATLNTNTIHVGDPIRLRLTVIHPAGSQLFIPDISQGKDLIIRNQKTRTEPLGSEKTKTITTYDLTSLAIGDHVVSSNVITCVTDNGITLTNLFPFQHFQVATLLTNKNIHVQSIKDITNWPGVFPRWLLVLILITLLATIIGLMVRHILTRRRTILRYPPPTPPYELALRELRALRSKHYIEELKAEPFFVELSGIVRRYLEKRFNLRAPERTTEEFIREAANSRILNTDQQYRVRDFLEQSDLVKFARHNPRKEDMETAFESAEQLVLETTPKPEAQGEEEPSL